ncbi:MAG: hypothetical protein NXI03_07860, partial [Alphaproteobacteria bacterium]|nr:hypothetical protein [Alphaproteobacteria bacterium]
TTLLSALRASAVGIASATAAMFRFGVSMTVAAARSGTTMVAGLLRMGAVLGGSLLTGIRAAIGAMRALTVAMMTNPVGLIIGGIALAAGLIITYWEPISTFFSGLWTGVTGAFDGFTTWLSGWWGRLQTDTGGAIMELLGVFWNFTPMGIIQNGLQMAADLLAKTEWGSFAIDIVKGLGAGFRESMSEVLAPVGEIADNIKNKFKSMLGISSPSRVFSGFGGDLAAGLSQGITGGQSAVVARAAALAAGVAAGAAVTIPAPVYASATPPGIQRPAVSAAIQPGIQRPALPAPIQPGIARPTPSVVIPSPVASAPQIFRGPETVDLPARSADGGAGGSRGGSSPGGSININFSPTITITGGNGETAEADIRKALRDLGPDLARLVQEAVERRNRTRY